ncbi:hypothetical protein BCR33DRAFT_367617 [Rhizoclosmatium globosum]|uniref:Uncharacterized protein n=1 Tax=Rhizoclosmatium globosum TaxID=329046 RepID=A0A1Y2C0I4_9FUNG|nr:hypothetical protein BCR33DRAFT_367617 [Rhizoclosmatium globosum]|eukprot:ORY40530.1 hypothetical protein BCR33DRAFT_367617 [Rhizoclosmatium globosum]
MTAPFPVPPPVGAPPPPPIWICGSPGQRIAYCGQIGCSESVKCTDPTLTCQYVPPPLQNPTPCTGAPFGYPNYEYALIAASVPSPLPSPVGTRNDTGVVMMHSPVPTNASNGTSAAGPSLSSPQANNMSTGSVFALGLVGGIASIVIVFAAVFAIKYRNGSHRVFAKGSDEECVVGRQETKVSKVESTDPSPTVQIRGPPIRAVVRYDVDDFFDDSSSRYGESVMDVPYGHTHTAPALNNMETPRGVASGILELEGVLRRLHQQHSGDAGELSARQLDGWDEESVNTGMSVGDATLKRYDLR